MRAIERAVPADRAYAPISSARRRPTSCSSARSSRSAHRAARRPKRSRPPAPSGIPIVVGAASWDHLTSKGLAACGARCAVGVERGAAAPRRWNCTASRRSHRRLWRAVARSLVRAGGSARRRRAFRARARPSTVAVRSCSTSARRRTWRPVDQRSRGSSTMAGRACEPAMPAGAAGHRDGPAASIERQAVAGPARLRSSTSGCHAARYSGMPLSDAEVETFRHRCWPATPWSASTRPR